MFFCTPHSLSHTTHTNTPKISAMHSNKSIFSFLFFNFSYINRLDTFGIHRDRTKSYQFLLVRCRCVKQPHFSSSLFFMVYVCVCLGFVKLVFYSMAKKNERNFATPTKYIKVSSSIKQTFYCFAAYHDRTQQEYNQQQPK